MLHGLITGSAKTARYSYSLTSLTVRINFIWQENLPNYQPLAFLFAITVRALRYPKVQCRKRLPTFHPAPTAPGTRVPVK